MYMYMYMYMYTCQGGKSRPISSSFLPLSLPSIPPTGPHIRHGRPVPEGQSPGEEVPGGEGEEESSAEALGAGWDQAGQHSRHQGQGGWGGRGREGEGGRYGSRRQIWRLFYANSPPPFLLQGANPGQDDPSNYRSSQQFADHMKGSSQAVSAFAKSKTLKEQRQFLPIYAARQEVCTVLYMYLYMYVCALITTRISLSLSLSLSATECDQGQQCGGDSGRDWFRKDHTAHSGACTTCTICAVNLPCTCTCTCTYVQCLLYIHTCILKTCILQYMYNVNNMHCMCFVLL